MAATALIVLDQTGAGPAGEALEGTIVGGQVDVTNDDDTDVLSWSITLVDAPPASGLASGTVLASASSGTPAANFTPDVAGSYRILLDVWDAAGETGNRSRDIRNFGIRNGRNIIVPPYQQIPPPVPLTGLSAKPDEQNYGGQTRGWAGDGSSGQLQEFMTTYDDQQFVTVTATTHSTDALGPPLIVVDTATAGADTTVTLPTGTAMRVGQRIRVASDYSGTYAVTVDLPGAHTINSSLTTWTLLPGMTVEFVYTGSSNYLVADASFDRYERSIVASTEDTDLVGFTAIGATYLDPANFPNLVGVTWQAIIETTNAADAAEIRLYNVTDALVVGSSTLSTVALIPTLVSAAITLAAGAKLYEAQLRLATTGTPNRATCKQAQIILEWFQ